MWSLERLNGKAPAYRVQCTMCTTTVLSLTDLSRIVKLFYFGHFLCYYVTVASK